MAKESLAFDFVWWDRFYELCYILFEKVVDSGYQPDVIVGIARGGWVPARILSDLFFTRETANVKVDLYRGIYEREEAPKVIQTIPSNMQWEQPILVDDISDTGDSLKAALEHMQKRGLSDCKTACLHVKPWTKLVPDYYVVETEAWVVYPWELKEFTFQLATQFSEKGLSSKEIEHELFQVGLPMYYARVFFKQWQAKSRSPPSEKTAELTSKEKTKSG